MPTRDKHRYLLGSILGAVLVIAAPLLFAQEQEVPVTFKQQQWANELVFVGTVSDAGWLSTPSKTPRSTATLGIQISKEGQERLQWHLISNNSPARLELHKAKAPADFQGKITMEKGGTFVLFTESTSVTIRSLKSHLALRPGYFAARINDAHISSHWITFQINP